LTLGLDRRLDLPMESSMRPTYDNFSHHSTEVDRQRLARPSSSRVSYITYLRPSRSFADAGGQIRTPADTAAPAPACGRCLRVGDSGYTLDAGADITLPKGAGLNAQGTGKIKNALPAWMRNRRITCGSVTRQFAPIAWASGLQPVSVWPRQTGAACSAPATAANAALRTGRIPVTNPVLLGSPPPGRRVTMDNRLCRLVRRSEPGDWCGAAAGRCGHVRP
jgi:hypothetical protein